MFFLKKKIYPVVLGSLVTLSACSELTPSPVEQMQQIQQNAMKQTEEVKSLPKQAKVSVVKKQSVTRFICKKDKEVQVRSSQTKNGKNAKLNAISVSFAGTTHTLSPTVTRNGKKYSNIRWVWWEPLNGKAELYDNKKNVLAEGCVKQPE